MRNRDEHTKKHALHCQWRRTKNDHVAKLPRAQGKLQEVWHTFGIGMPKSGEAEEGLDHMGEALTGRHFHAHVGISVACIPPVVPCIRFDGSGLALAKYARPAAPLHGQLTLKNGEALDNPGMAVFADDLRTYTRDKLGHCAAIGILVGKLKNGGALASDGILPHLADFDRPKIRYAVGVRM